MNQTEDDILKEVEIRQAIDDLIDFIEYEGIKYQWPVQYNHENTHNYLTRVFYDVDKIVHQIRLAKQEKKRWANDLLQWAINDDTDEAQYRKNYYQQQQQKRQSEADILEEEIQYQRAREKKAYKVTEEDLERLRETKQREKQQWDSTTEEQHRMNRNREPDPSIQDEKDRMKANPKPPPKPQYKPPRASEQQAKQDAEALSKKQSFYADLARQLPKK